MDSQKDGCEGCMDGQMGGCGGGGLKQTDGRVDEWTDGQEGG